MQHEWREGNRVILLPEASRFLPAMFEAVSQAQHYVLVELYLMESGELANQVIDALEAATRRGVKTYLLLDGYGAMGLERSDRERLQAAGVALQLFNPIGFHSLARNLSRDHRKIVVVDGEVAFTGGFGAVDEFLEAWYEIAARVEGPVVADWEALFRRLWCSRLTRYASPQGPRLALPEARVAAGRGCQGQGHLGAWLSLPGHSALTLRAGPPVSPTTVVMYALFCADICAASSPDSSRPARRRRSSATARCQARPPRRALCGSAFLSRAAESGRAYFRVPADFYTRQVRPGR